MKVMKEPKMTTGQNSSLGINNPVILFSVNASVE